MTEKLTDEICWKLCNNYHILESLNIHIIIIFGAMWYTLSQNLELSKVGRKNYNLPFHKSITRGRHFVPRNNQRAQWCRASSGSQTEYASGLFVTSGIPAMQSAQVPPRPSVIGYKPKMSSTPPQTVLEVYLNHSTALYVFRMLFQTKGKLLLADYFSWQPGSGPHWRNELIPWDAFSPARCCKFLKTVLKTTAS